MRTKTVTRLDSLTNAQRARFPEWVERWTRKGLSTERADRAQAEKGILAYYAAAGLAPPNRIVWVPSPIVGAYAFPAAALILAAEKRTGASVGDSVRDSVGDSVRASVGDSVGDSVGASVGASVGDSVRDSVGASVRDSVRDSVDASVRASVRDSVGDSVRASVGASVRASVGDSVGDSVRDSVRDSVDASVRASVDASVGADPKVTEAYQSCLRESWHRYMGGQFWVGHGWYGYWSSPSMLSFFRDVCGLHLGDRQPIADAIIAAGESCCWWWPHREFVMVCERPTVIARDDGGRLHSETGPAAGWDGWGVYAIHGVRVPAHVVEHPESITLAQIEAEANAEVKRIMIDRYGMGRYVRDSKFELVDEERDQHGQSRRLLRRAGLTVVELVNSTEDADGSRRVYHVAVHPELRPLFPDGSIGEPQTLTALNAVASTYGLTGAEYNLSQES